MPELPEVEAVCRKLREAALGQTLVRAHVLRPGIVAPQSVDEFEQAVNGRKIKAIYRRAKNLFLGLSGGVTLRVHLRMTGNLYGTPDVRFRPETTRAYFGFRGHRGLLFTDPRALGRMRTYTEGELERLLAEFGPEPLDESFTADRFAATAKSSRQPAKLFLMDQTRVAGLGNIYAAEALFRARVHPTRSMARLSKARLVRLHGAIVQVLRDAVQSACTAYSGPGPFGEAETFSRYVYDRERQPCMVCGRPIRRIAQGGRSTYYCPGCQK